MNKFIYTAINYDTDFKQADLEKGLMSVASLYNNIELYSTNIELITCFSLLINNTKINLYK